ncbi:replicative DNA helicase [Pseudomonas sp. WS 5532]|uniref:replicative DNA helicase n=1 Tax=Pseudomonas sp. WS 5532 TaxID=2717495 RepID=UPI0014751156|nr:replicative DNA helicase [Pseudomonas sp. WS 5532]NMX77777.1 replicative DNA helicase [Pseudomonas sp. WS 5532]
MLITSSTEVYSEPAPSKVPPHSVEAEQSVLGGLIRDNTAYESILDLVSQEDFYLNDHRLIFNAIAELAERDQPFDAITLHEQLGKDVAGGADYFNALRRYTVSVANIRFYAQVVRERAVLRQIISTCNDITDLAINPQGRSAVELIEDAEQSILSIADMRPKGGGPVGLDELLTKAHEKIKRLATSGQAVTGLATGFDDLDKKLDGLRPSDLIIVAGRPSMGKTTFAMNIVENAVVRNDKVVVVYSLEMPGAALLNRMLSSLGSVDQTRVRSGQLQEDDWPRLTGAINQLNDKKLFIDDTAGITPFEMRSRTRRILREHGEIGLIMVDYLQLMQVPGAKGGNRTNEISTISRALKALAKEFKCPVVALSQLNRGVEERKNKRPLNSDLRESGAIEQDADVIMFVYRDEIYYPDSKFKGTAEIIIGKNREGPVSFSRLSFLGQYTRFENLKPGTHDFTDAELGVVTPDPNPRLGRLSAGQLATLGKLKRLDGPRPGIMRGSTPKP